VRLRPIGLFCASSESSESLDNGVNTSDSKLGPKLVCGFIEFIFVFLRIVWPYLVLPGEITHQGVGHFSPRKAPIMGRRQNR